MIAEAAFPFDVEARQVAHLVDGDLFLTPVTKDGWSQYAALSILTGRTPVEELQRILGTLRGWSANRRIDDNYLERKRDPSSREGGDETTLEAFCIKEKCSLYICRPTPRGGLDCEVFPRGSRKPTLTHENHPCGLFVHDRHYQALRWSKPEDALSQLAEAFTQDGGLMNEMRYYRRLIKAIENGERPSHCALCFRPAPSRTDLAESHIFSNCLLSMISSEWHQDNTFRTTSRTDVTRLLCHRGRKLPAGETGPRCEERLSAQGEQGASTTLAGVDWKKEMGPDQLQDGWLMKGRRLASSLASTTDQFDYTEHLFHAIASLAWRLLLCGKTESPNMKLSDRLALMTVLRRFIRDPTSDHARPFAILMFPSKAGMSQSYDHSEPWKVSHMVQSHDILVHLAIRGFHFVVCAEWFSGQLGVGMMRLSCEGGSITLSSDHLVPPEVGQNLIEGFRQNSYQPSINSANLDHLRSLPQGTNIPESAQGQPYTGGPVVRLASGWKWKDSTLTVPSTSRVERSRKVSLRDVDFTLFLVVQPRTGKSTMVICVQEIVYAFDVTTEEGQGPTFSAASNTSHQGFLETMLAHEFVLGLWSDLNRE